MIVTIHKQRPMLKDLAKPGRLVMLLAALLARPSLALPAIPPVTVVVGDAAKITAPGTWRAVPQDDGSLTLVPPQDTGIVRAIITAEQRAPGVEDFLAVNLPSLESGLKWARVAQPVVARSPGSETGVARLKGKGARGLDGLAIWRLKHASGTIVTALLLGEPAAVEAFDPALSTIMDNAVLFPTPPADWQRHTHRNGTTIIHPPTWTIEEGADALLLVPSDAKASETYQFTGGTSGKEAAANTPATLNNLDTSLAQIYPGAQRESEPDTFDVGPYLGVMLKYTLPDRNGLRAHVYAVIIDDVAIALIASGTPEDLNARESIIRQTFATIRYSKPAPEPKPDAPAALPPAK